MASSSSSSAADSLQPVVNLCTDDTVPSRTEEDREEISFPSTKKELSSSPSHGLLGVVQKKREEENRLNQGLNGDSKQGNGQRAANNSTRKRASGVTPALVSNPDHLQRFLNNQECITHLSVSFDLTPAFQSTSDEVREFYKRRGGPLQEERRDPARFNERSLSHEHTDYHDHNVSQDQSSVSSERIQDNSSHHLPSRLYHAVFPKPPVNPGHKYIASEAKCCIQPAVPGSSVGEDSPSLVKYIYNQWDPSSMSYLLPDVKRDGFPTKQLLLSTRRVADSTLIYCNEEFAKEANLSCGADVKNLFPSPTSVRRSTPVSRRLKFFKKMDDERRELGLDVDIDDQMINILGAGGNGVVFSLVMNGRQYAVKLSRYNKRELDFWCRAVHPNVLPLLAVVWLSPGYCYLVMPKMAGNLSSLLHSVGDLADFAFREDDEGLWVTTVIPNLQHLLTSILRGLAYIHEKGFQHCDLKESNILYTMECSCSNIFFCECEPGRKNAKIVISDFDSIKPFSTDRGEGTRARAITNCGTQYYRPPELFKGFVTQYGDMWSFGIIICHLFHSRDEKKELLDRCRVMARDYHHQKDLLPLNELLFSREILYSLQKKSHKAPLVHRGVHSEGRLMPIAKMSFPCLELAYKKRLSAQALLKDAFFWK